MSIYAKPVSQITAVDLQDMVANGDVENLRLEFKSDVPDKDETLKKLSSFANTYGGTTVVGATASSATGKVESLRNVEPPPGYKQKVVGCCCLGATPPVTVEVSDPIPVENGRVCYVIRVPESDLAPHFLNGRKGIWVQWTTANVPPLQRLSETRATPLLLLGTMKESLPSSASLSTPEIEKQDNGTS